MDEQIAAQAHLPLLFGGVDTGAVSYRADAAYLSGAMTAMATIQETLGVQTVAELRASYGAYTDSLDTTVNNLKASGVTDELDRWKAGQPFNTKGKQREWCREIALAKKNQVIQQASRRHAAA